MIHANLLDQVLGGGALVWLLLAESEAFVCLYQFALRVDNHCLELVPLPDQLLVVRIDLLLQLQVLFEKGVPLALTASFASLVLFHESA